MFLEKFSTPLDISTPGIRLPEVKLSDEDIKKYKIPADADNVTALRIICREGYKRLVKLGDIPKDKAKEYGDRVNKELAILEKTNFVDYILLIYDLISFRNRRNLAKSYGRGSCAGSLVCHLIGITNCDPIKNGLFFERFISESRAKTNIIDGKIYLSGTLPDVDMDLADEERHELVNYLMHKYPGKVVKLSTISTFATKALTGELCKVFFKWKKEDYAFLTKEIVSKFGKVPSPAEVRKESEVFDKFCKENPIFWKCLQDLHECNRSASSHASAYFLSHDPLEKVMPIQLGKKINEDGEEEGELEQVSAFDMYTSETLGIKVDLLGVKSLTMAEAIAKATGEDLSRLDFNDYDSIYKYLKDLKHPHGLFQISGTAAIKGLNKIKPKNLEELAVVSAICRPGALEFIDSYAEFTNHGVTKSLHPFFDEILDKTAGNVIFQESLLSLLNKIGFTLEECELARRAISKKDKSKTAEINSKAYERAEKSGCPKEAVDLVMDIAVKSADYSFNKCLSLDSMVYNKDMDTIPIQNIKVGDEIMSYDYSQDCNKPVTVLNIYKQKSQLYKFTTSNNKEITCSMEHKLLCFDGVMRTMKRIIEEDLDVICQ